LEILAPIVSSIHLIPIESPRAVSVDQLHRLSRSLTPAIPSYCDTSLRDALGAPTQERRLVTGSLFLVGDALALINHTLKEESLQ
jgi:folylpolyglutamate synthase/dihydropteroate synthase